MGLLSFVKEAGEKLFYHDAAARRILVLHERQYRAPATRLACVGKKVLTSAINTLDHCLMQPRRSVRCDTDWLLA